MSTKGHAALRYVGTNAERVALATGPLITGAIWIETDTLDIYLWDGTAWAEVSLDADGIYLRLDATNDPVTAGLEVNAATADEPVLIVQTTDDDDTNDLTEWRNSGDSVLASIGSQGHLGIGVAPNDNYVLYFTFVSELTLGHARGVYGTVESDSPGLSSAEFRGVMGAAQINGNAQTYTGKHEGGFFAVGTGSGGAYTIGTANGTRSQIQNTGDGTITNASGMFIDNALNSGAGAITNLYGLYIDNQNVADTLNYAIYTKLGDIRFGDQVEIEGSAAADVQLTVKGAAAQSANLLELQESDGSIMLSSGDGLGGSVFAGNVQLEDIDFVWAGDTEANLFRVDAGEDEVRLGDWDTNYSAFEVDGTLEFNGNATVYNDIYFPMSSGRVGGANAPTWAAFQGNIYEYTFAINDYIHLPSGEVAHSYKEGSNFELHCHIVLDGSDVGDTYVNYEIEYTIGDMGEVMSAATVVTSGDTLIAGGTADRTHIYVDIGDITGTGFKIGAAIKMRFRRIALVGGGLNAPSNDPFVLMAGIHIEEDTVGSRTETAK